MVRLVYNDQSGRECFVEMNAQNSVLMIGRNPDCGIQTNNASVSRVHAMLTFKDGKLFVQDPPNGRPTNGTKIDGMRLQPGEVLELFAKSKLVCGNFEIQVVSDGSGASVAQMGVPVTGQTPYGQPMDHAKNGMNKASQGGMRDPRYGTQQAGSYGQGGYPQQQGYPQQGNANAQNMPNAKGQGMSAQANAGYDNNPPMPKRQGYEASQNMQRQSFDAQRAQYDAPSSPRSSAGKYEGRNPRMGRMAGPQAFHPSAPSANTASSNMGNVSQGSSSQFASVPSQDASENMRELEEARASKAALEDELKKVKDELEACKRELADFAQQREVNDMANSGYKDTIEKLKGQLDHQIKQNSSCKAELAEMQEQNANLQVELESLRDSLESRGIESSNAETTIANLKVQLSSKSRQLNEIMKELTKAQADAQEERANAQRLEDNVHELNASLDDFQNRCRDMKKVIDSHENRVEDLRVMIEEKDAEIKKVNDMLKRGANADVSKLMQEASQARDQLNKKIAELNDAGKELEEAGKEIESLRAQLSEALAASASMPVASSSVDSEMLDHLRDVSRNIGDTVGQWRSEFQNLESSITSLQQVFVPYVRLDVNALTGQDKVRVENMLKKYDPRAIFEEIGNALDVCQNCLSEIKGQTRELRDVLSSD